RRGAQPVAGERQRRVEGAAPPHLADARDIHGQTFNPVRTGVDTRLHAREGDHRRRRRLRRELQPLPLRRAERGERAGDRRRRARRADGELRRRDPRALSRSRAVKRHAITAVAAVAIAVTFGVMAGFDWTATLGAIAFAPWVALIGFDSGPWAGVASAAFATAGWRVATGIDELPTTSGQLVVRAVFFAVLGCGTAIVGRRLRESQHAQESTSALQSALIDSTLDGIALTDAYGNILIMNAPIVRMAVELGMPIEGTVPERLLAIADRITEPERYRRRMLELASHPTEAASDEFELVESGRVFRGYAAPVRDRSGRFVGRIWTLREVTADRELDRMRDAFVATVSHELRTPLTSIAGFVEMLQSEGAGMSEDARTYLRVIARSSDRLQHLVEDLLLMAQI